MSTQSVTSSGGAVGVPLNITGLASGLNTNEIINALMSVEREPVTQMTDRQTVLQAQKTQLSTIQSSLQQLAFSAADLASPSLFNSSQSVSSSNPTQISAATTSGAGVGGYQVNVTQLANSAQRTFTFASPTSAQSLTIDGHEFKLEAGMTLKEFAAQINSEPEASVYAAALEEGKLVLSTRATGNTGTEFIQLSDPEGALKEVAGSAKQGRNAEYTVDGVAGTSTSNTVTNAIAGVTLTLNALTTTSGPVTVNVAAPGPNVKTIAAQVQSFVSLYNSTIGSIQTQLNTKPPTNPNSASEFGTGTLYGDNELSDLLNKMRQAIYDPVEGMPAEMSSLASIGISTGAPSGSGGYSQTSLEGQLTINSSELENAIQSNPAGVEKMLQSWSQSFQTVVNAEAEPGGNLEVRINSDGSQITDLSGQIETMNEMLTMRQEALQAEYAALEGVISQNQAQSTWLTSQTAALVANDG